MTVDDPVAPAIASGLPGDGVRRTNEIFTAAATDSAGVRSLRVLVDGVARVDDHYTCDFRLAAPCAASRSRDFDLAGVPDGRHTVTTIAEDAASNVTRTEQVIDVDGTAPVIDRVPVNGRTVTVLVSDAGSGLAGGTIEVRDGTKPSYALKTTLRTGRLTATVPRSISMSRLGIHLSVADRAGNAFNAVVTSMSLSTRVGKARSRKVRNERATIGYGRAVTVLGRLTTVDGSPLAGQPIVLAGIERRAGAAAAELAPREHRQPAAASASRSPPAPAATSSSATRARPVSCTARARSACASRPARRSTPPAPRCAARARSASPAACAPSAPRCRREARSSTSRPPSAAAGRPSPPPAPAAPPAPGAPSHASAAPRAATRSACASAAKRCSPTNWGTPPPWWYASGEIRRSFRAGTGPRVASRRPRGRTTWSTCSPLGRVG